MKFRVWVISLLMLMLSAAHAVEYRLPDMHGKMHSFTEYRGKWVIVSYWATWCHSCLKELPELNALYEKFKSNNVVVVGINFEDVDYDVLKNFIAQTNIKFPILKSAPDINTPLGPVPALPTTYIIDPEGVAVAGQVGVMSQSDIEIYLQKKGLAVN